MPAPEKKKRCTPSTKTVHLDVLAGEGDTSALKIAKSKMAPRRAMVLVAVHVVLLAHVVLWLVGAFDGKTITPIEPSEAMQTLEVGFVNAGFVVFALALLSTVIFGRFFCGWGCHLIAMQDLCGWMMKKCGVRPKPFRSRVLIWVPLLVALYMFVWPNFKRFALFPILDNLAPSAKVLLAPVAEWQGLSNHLISEYYWSNPETGVAFPIIMAIPTLLIVSIGAVYFLGSKGFCTYGCPYGGFIAPLDEWSPMSIRVNDNCEQCGHCTATCSSNVRVHEEVREFGMVVDSGCMKCMDCISVCPNDALYLGFGRPAVKKGKPKNKKPKPLYDLSLREDLLVGLVFILAVLGVRGLYLWEAVPFLMSIGFAGIFAFMAFKSWRLLSRANQLIRIQSLNLKSQGRVRLPGWILLLMVVALSIVLAGNGVVNYSSWRAGMIMSTPPILDYAQAPVQIERPPDVLQSAGDAISHLNRARGVADGGFAIMTNPVVWTKLAAMHGVRAEFAEAETMLARGITQSGERDQACATLANFMYRGDKPGESLTYIKDVLARNPNFERTFDTAIFLIHNIEGQDEAEAFARQMRSKHEGHLVATRALIEILVNQGENDEAIDLAREAIAEYPGELRLYSGLAGAYFQAARLVDAVPVLQDAIRRFPREPELHMRLSQIYTMIGESEGAAFHEQRARELGGGQ